MKLLILLLVAAFLLPVQTPPQNPATPARPEQNPPEQPAPAPIEVKFIDEVGSKAWCSIRPEPGPVVDEATFKKILEKEECASFLKKLTVDFSKQSLITYHVHGDCFVHGSIKILRDDTLKKYIFSVTKHYGGCRAAGSYQ